MKTLTSPRNKTVSNILSAESMHTINQRWLSTLRFNTDEIKFLNKLLSSYVFEPRNETDFGRVSGFQHKLKAFTTKFSGLAMDIACQQSAVGGTMECRDHQPGKAMEESQLELQTRFNCMIEEYDALKLEIFGYAGKALRKGKGKEAQ